MDPPNVGLVECKKWMVLSGLGALPVVLVATSHKKCWMVAVFGCAVANARQHWVWFASHFCGIFCRYIYYPHTITPWTESVQQSRVQATSTTALPLHCLWGKVGKTCSIGYWWVSKCAVFDSYWEDVPVMFNLHTSLLFTQVRADKNKQPVDLQEGKRNIPLSHQNHRWLSPSWRGVIHQQGEIETIISLQALRPGRD